MRAADVVRYASPLRRCINSSRLLALERTLAPQLGRRHAEASRQRAPVGRSAVLAVTTPDPTDETRQPPLAGNPDLLSLVELLKSFGRKSCASALLTLPRCGRGSSVPFSTMPGLVIDADSGTPWGRLSTCHSRAPNGKPKPRRRQVAHLPITPRGDHAVRSLARRRSGLRMLAGW